MVLIHKNYVLNSKWISFDPIDGQFTFLDDKPNLAPSDWELSNEYVTNDYKSIAKVCGFEFKNVEIETYRKIYKQFGAELNSSSEISIVKYKAILNDLFDKIKDIWTKTEIDRKYYLDFHKQKVDFLSSFERIKIDRSYFDKLKIENSIIESFKPDDDGFCKNIKYTFDETKTGRLKVVDGPNVNLLPTEHRKHIFQSRYVNGVIASVDFVSAEMQTILVKNGSIPRQDIYQYFSDFNNLELDREVCKKALISAVYGASATLLKSIIGSQEKAEEILELAEEFLKIEDNNSELQEECSDNDGHFYNMFGRRLIGENTKNYLNAWAQSTAVDVSIIGFKNLTENMTKQGMKYCPLFVLHDGLYLDMESKSEFDKLKELCQNGTTVNGLSYPLKVTC